MKIKKNLRNIFCILGFLTIIYIIYNLIFHNVSYTINPLQLILSIIIYILFIFILWKIYQKFLLNKKYGIPIVFLIFVLLQLIFACVFVVKPTWDFGTVYKIVLDDIINGNSIFNAIYMNQVKLNLGIGILLKIVFYPFYYLGINHYVIVGILLNIIFIDLGLIYLYKLITLVTNKKISTICLFMILTFTPFICYVPIFYTDTLSLPFGIIGLYYVFKYFYTNDNKKRYLVISGISLGIGGCIKTPVLIVYIAILIWLIFREKKDPVKSTIKKTVLLTICMLIPFVTFNIYVSSHLEESMLKKYQIPKTHWIMMGLTGNGGFNESEADFTTSFPTEEAKKNANIRVIKERLKKYWNNHTIIQFYTNKLTYTWGDGTFFAAEKLQREPKYTTIASKYVYGEEKWYYYGFAQAEWLVALILIAIGIVLRPYLTYKQRDLQLLSLISTAGILILLLIWETRSRYLVNLLPVILISTYIGIIGIRNYYQIKKEKSK